MEWLSVAAIIPAHNAAETLPDTLASVARQSLPPAEVIVVDDGSEDGTTAVARSHGARCVRTAGGSVAGARNAGIASTSCDWVALLDSDDRWHPGHLAGMAAALRYSPNAIACFAAAEVVNDDAVLVGAHPIPRGLLGRDDIVRGRIVPTTSASMLRRSAVRDVGGFDEEFERPAGVEDLDLWFRLAEAGPCIGVSEPSATYVLHEQRDRSRSASELAALERDRERVIRRLAERGAVPMTVVRHGGAIMSARTARYWLLAGQTRSARRAAAESIRLRPTVEGIVTLAASCTPARPREAARRLWRRRRLRHVRP